MCILITMVHFFRRSICFILWETCFFKVSVMSPTTVSSVCVCIHPLVILHTSDEVGSSSHLLTKRLQNIYLMRSKVLWNYISPTTLGIRDWIPISAFNLVDFSTSSGWVINHLLQTSTVGDCNTQTFSLSSFHRFSHSFLGDTVSLIYCLLCLSLGLGNLRVAGIIAGAAWLGIFQQVLEKEKYAALFSVPWSKLCLWWCN